MSATRLLVLGVVRMLGDAHGYQVRRELLTWSADKWANVAPGSIYHALKKMASEGLLTEIEQEGESGGPDRVTYRLTEDGETEFQVTQAKMLASVGEGTQQDAHELAAALTFLTTLPRAKAISLLQHRVTSLEGQRKTVRNVLEHGGSWGHPAHVNEHYRLWNASIDAVIDWAEKLVARLEAGEYVMADDPEPSFGERARPDK